VILKELGQMIDLIPKPPLEGLDLTLAGVRLRACPMAPIFSIAPFRGARAAFDAALDQAYGLRFPDPCESTGDARVRLIWTGRDQAFLCGAVPDPGLYPFAAITDQSDGWAVLELAGPQSAAVLARLTPFDLRLRSFGAGRTARTALQHMICVLLRVEQDVFRIFVMRSMAKTAAHEIGEAMKSLAARE
jgi:sarcosine oxidase subunit gamma